LGPRLQIVVLGPAFSRLFIIYQCHTPVENAIVGQPVTLMPRLIASAELDMAALVDCHFVALVLVVFADERMLADDCLKVLFVHCCGPFSRAPLDNTASAFAASIDASASLCRAANFVDGNLVDVSTGEIIDTSKGATTNAPIAACMQLEEAKPTTEPAATIPPSFPQPRARPSSVEFEDVPAFLLRNSDNSVSSVPLAPPSEPQAGISGEASG